MIMILTGGESRLLCRSFIRSDWGIADPNVDKVLNNMGDKIGRHALSFGTYNLIYQLLRYFVVESGSRA